MYLLACQVTVTVRDIRSPVMFARRLSSSIISTVNHSGDLLSSFENVSAFCQE